MTYSTSLHSRGLVSFALNEIKFTFTRETRRGLGLLWGWGRGGDWVKLTREEAGQRLGRLSVKKQILFFNGDRGTL